MKQYQAIAWVLAGCAVGWSDPVGAEVSTGQMKMQKAVEYPHAGIMLAVPTGFTVSEQLFGEFQVLTASRIEGKQATQFISLAAYPVNGKVTPASLLETLREPMKNRLAIRDLKVEKTADISVAGRKATAVHMTYTFRGIKTVTLSACFIRDIVPVTAQKPSAETQPARRRLAYVLTLEVADAHRHTLLKTFEAVLRTIMMTAVRRPIDSPIHFDGPYLRNLPQGYALRMPVGWVGGQNAIGLYFLQVDYLLGGIPCPSVQIVSGKVDPSATAQACGQKAIDYMRKQGLKVDILSEGPARLAKRDGYQFVLRKTRAPATRPTTEKAKTTTTLEVHRLLCVPPNENLYEEKAWNYAMIVAGRDVTVEQLTNLADQLARRFIVTPAREE